MTKNICQIIGYFNQGNAQYYMKRVMMKNFSNKENFELIFIYLPGKKLNEGSLYYKDIISLINKEKVKLIDLSSSNFYKKNIFYPKYGEHFNQKGYEELSIKIHNELSQM